MNGTMVLLHWYEGSHVNQQKLDFTLIVPLGFATQRLAHMLDSLVRVSRRVRWGSD
jgi:hypothetical protein